MSAMPKNHAARLLGALAVTTPLLLALWLATGTAACAEKPAEGGAAASACEATVLATVGSRSITQGEVEEALPNSARQQLYEIMAGGLQQRVAEVMRELDAEAAGMTVDELVAREVEAKVAPVTDADVDLFYEQNKARINTPKEEIAGRVREHLEQQRRGEAMNAWMGQLREKYAVTTLLEPVRMEVAADGFPAVGPAEAPVTIVEFSDFQCPYCSRIAPTLKQVTEKYGDQVRFVFRQFPLNIHAQAQKAAEASLCANEQGKFWEMHDAMFADQRNLGVDQLKEKATQIGLDGAAFAECLDSGRTAEAVSADLQAGSALGVSGTPATFINGRPLSGAVPFEQLAALVDEELARLGRGAQEGS